MPRSSSWDAWATPMAARAIQQLALLDRRRRPLGRALAPGGLLDRLLADKGVVDRLIADGRPLVSPAGRGGRRRPARPPGRPPHRLLAEGGALDRLTERDGTLDRVLQPYGGARTGCSRRTAWWSTCSRTTERSSACSTPTAPWNWLLAEDGALDRLLEEDGPDRHRLLAEDGPPSGSAETVKQRSAAGRPRRHTSAGSAHEEEPATLGRAGRIAGPPRLGVPLVEQLAE